MDELQKQYNALLAEVEILRKENSEMKSLLLEHGLSYVPESSIQKACIVSLYSSANFPPVNIGAEQRIALFHSLFRGREDVFARRWYNKKTEKGGYQPVCVNEWRRGVCDRKKFKCTECPNRNFAPLSYHDLYRHLEGKDEYGCDVVGIYAIMSDNCCAFLCADFDDKSCEHGYKNDVLAFVGVCKDWGIPYTIERSRSGNGAHVWIFFDGTLPAYKARRLGNAILTEAMTRDGRLSFNSYDRFFPNQDMMPEGGFGNLVALPLQGRACKMLNSVFVDDNFLAYKDQWAYLCQVKKVREAQVDSLLSLHEIDDFSNFTMTSESKPWVTPIPQSISPLDFNGTIDITRADKIYIPLKSVSTKVVNHLKRFAAFKNQEFYKNQAMRLSTFGIPRIISCADFTDEYICMPRGCEEAITKLLEDHRVCYKILDETNHGSPISVHFNGKEREEQLDAINALLPHSNGVLHATTAFGKTVTAASIIARRRVNTLILVHTKALLDQWQQRLLEFLDIEYEETEVTKKRGRKKAFSPIGSLDSTKNTLHGIIDIAIIQSCLDDGEVKPFVHDYGMIIVDECHHVSSVTFESVLKSVSAQYVYGLTATPIRKDGHQPIIFMQCGPIRFSADAKSQIAKQSFRRYLVPRFTSFRSITEPKTFNNIKKEIAIDEVRNKLIVEDVSIALSNGRTPILMTDLTSHVSLLATMLEPHCKNVICLTGTGSAKEKKAALLHLQEVPKDEPLIIVATGKYVGEGFDFPRLDTLFLVSPISWKGRLQQYAGRLHRECEGKDVRVYDYIDIHEPICDTMYHRRLNGYASIGYFTITKNSPTLFDNLEDIGFSTNEGQIFNGRTYYKPFTKDITTAKRSIVISSPKLYAVQRQNIVNMLKKLSVSGLEIMVLTRSDDEQSNYLKTQGLSVYIVPSLSLCCAIIDKQQVWYGCVNALGFASEEDSVIRLSDSTLANELINELFGSDKLLPMSKANVSEFREKVLAGNVK